MRSTSTVTRGIALAGVAVGVAFQVVALVERQEFAAWRVALAVAALGGAWFPSGLRFRRAAPLADLLRLAGLAATAVFAWAGLLEGVLLAKPLLARELLLVAAGASLHVLLLFVADSTGRASAAAPRVVCKAWFAVTSVVLCACLVEWVFTWRMPAWIYDVVPDDPRLGTMIVSHPPLVHALRPGFRGRYVHPDFPGLRVEINALGMRDRPEEGVLPAAGDAVVLVLGDSFAFGTGVRLEETFQERLEARAAELTKRPLRVYGAGVPGYGQLDSLAQLEEIGASLHPDVVVEALFEGNDLQDNLRTMAMASGTLPLRRVPREPTATATLLRDQWARAGQISYWRGSSSALQFLWPALEEPLAALGLVPATLPTNDVLKQMLRFEPPPSVLKLGLETFEALRRMRVKSGELGAAFVVLVIPAAMQVDERLFEAFVRQVAAGDGGACDRTFFHRRLVDALRQDGFSVADPLPALEAAARADRGGYHHEGHLDVLGHQIVAETLLDPVKRSLER
jgi:hypothetical protein